MKKEYEYREPLEEKAWEKYGLVFWMTAVCVVFGSYGAFLDHEMNKLEHRLDCVHEEGHKPIIRNVNTR